MRISWIDNLRWIWIILILVGHSYFPDWSLLVKFLFSFHVALFFFLSWYLFNDIKHNKIIPFIKSKFNRLIIPFFFFNLITFSFYKIKEYTLWHKYHIDIESFLTWVVYGDYLPHSSDIILANVPTWFLTSLFIVSIYYFILNKYVKNKYYRLLTLIILSIIIYIESKYINFRLPWNMEISIIAMLFYWVWHSFKKEISKIVEKINLRYLFLVPFFIWFNLLFTNWTNFAANYYWESYILFLLNSIFWISSFIIISKLIWSSKILSFFWKNSIIVLWMEWIKFLVLSIVIKLSFDLLIFEKSYINAFIQIFWTLIILVPIIFTINKYLSFIIWSFKKNVQ